MPQKHKLNPSFLDSQVKYTIVVSVPTMPCCKNIAKKILRENVKLKLHSGQVPEKNVIYNGKSYNRISHYCATMHRFLQFIPFHFHIHKLLLLSPVLKWGLVCFGQQHIKGYMNVNSMTPLYAEGLASSRWGRQV